MNDHLKRCLTAVGALLVAFQMAEAKSLRLTVDGKANAEVVLDLAGPQRQLEYAATELTNWIAKISGAALPVVKAPSSLPVKIYLGTPDRSPAIAAFAKEAAADFKKLEGSDGFIIRRKDDAIFLGALKTKGVLNGVYRFLEKNTDIIFVREFEAEDGCGTLYGHHPTIANTIEDLVDLPVFPHHRHWTGNSDGNLIWQARLLCTSTRPLDGNMTPRIYKRTSTVQDVSEMEGTLGLGLIDPAVYYKDHPDYFPLVRGKRVCYHDCQLCFMNPGTIEAFTKEAAKVIAGNPKRVTSYYIGLGDNWDVCECPLCMAPIKLPDGRVVKPEDKNFRSTQYVLFKNAVYTRLMKRFPHIRPVTGQAYLFAAEAPAVPAVGGGLCYCPYIKNHKRPVFDDVVNKNWHEKAEEFKKAGMPFSALYEYYLCSSTPEFYHAICEVAQQDFNYYRPDLKGIYLDTTYGDTFNFGGGRVYDISAIEFWVMSRLMWNPEIDVKEARREFCRRAYREAAGPMIVYYERLAKNYNEDPAGCYWNDDPISACKYYLIDKNLDGFARKQLDEALAMAKHPGSRRLIELHRTRMLGLVEKAKSLPDKVTLHVPVVAKAPVSGDPDAEEWKVAALVDGFTRISDASKPSSRKSVVRFMHDKENLYIAFRFEDPEFYAHYKAGEYVRDPSGESGEWGGLRGPYAELFLDGNLRDVGSYYHMTFDVVGNRYTGKSASQIKEDVPVWSAETKVEPTYWTAKVTIPLSSIGMKISQGNRVGFMVVANNGAWNGGQWHSPTGFQNLVLEME